MPSKDKAIFATLFIQVAIFVAVIFSAIFLLNGSKFKSGSNLASYEEEAYDLTAESSSARGVRKMKASMSAPMAMSSAPSLLVEVANASEQNSKYLVKTGNIRGRVDSLDSQRSSLKKILSNHKAFIVSENQARYNQSINLDLDIKVPVNSFEELMSDLGKSTDFLDSKSSNIIDKFKEFTDIQENIKNQSLLRDKYRNILKNAKKVKDLLDIERELANVQRRIDGQQLQLNSLKDRISKSTIHASFYETVPLSVQKNQVSFLRQISNSIVKGFSRTKSLFLWMISIWPFIFIGAGLIVYFIKRRKR